MEPSIDPPDDELESFFSEEWYDEYSEEPSATCPHCLEKGVVEVDRDIPAAWCNACEAVWEDSTMGWDIAEVNGRDAYVKARMSEMSIDAKVDRETRRKEASENTVLY